MECTPSQPGLVGPLYHGRVWLNGHELVQGHSIGRAAVQPSSLTLEVHFHSLRGQTVARAWGNLSSFFHANLQGG